jgi:lysophospholipase L1-like esterase
MSIADPRPEPDRWQTAYTAALAHPADTLPFMPQPRSFRGQVVTQAVRLRRGGSRLRLLLSNQFGDQPLVIDAVTAATPGAAGVPVPLAGQPGWVIPPGAVRASDPFPSPAAAGDELTVRCRVGGQAGPGAYLHSAQRTGSATAPSPDSAPAGAASFPSLYWITRVLTDAPADGPVIVAFGDSVTRGDGTSLDADQRYPDHLQASLEEAGHPGAAVLNAGIGGNRVARPRVGPSMTERFDRDVLAVADATHVVIMGGVNDIGLPGLLGEPPATAAEIAGALLGLARRASGRGLRPVLGTVTPILGRYAHLSAPGNEVIRQEVNRAVRVQRDWPVADFAAAVADPADPGRLAAALDSGDGVHPNDAGARALAAAAAQALGIPASAGRY